MNWVMLFSVLTGFLAICTAIAQNIKEKKDSDERLADKNEIIKLQKENNSKLEAINKLQTQIIASSNNLIEANERIEALNMEVINYQTGGNSFPYVDIIKILDDQGKECISLAINKVGKYPVYGIKVTYWDVDEVLANVRADGRASIESLSKYKSVDIGDLPLNGSIPFGQIFKLNKDGIQKINLSIDTKNGKYSEQLRIAKKGEEISSAYKVNTITDGKEKPEILKEHADANFPKNQNGIIIWD